MNHNLLDADASPVPASSRARLLLLLLLLLLLPHAQDAVFDALGGAYAIIALVALAQLARIHARVPECGLTTQKVFHLLNASCALIRAVVFPLRRRLDAVRPRVIEHVLLDLPGLLFFSTYALLVLFWAEIYNQGASYTHVFHPSIGFNI
jgi:hypothetical protein